MDWGSLWCSYSRMVGDRSSMEQAEESHICQRHSKDWIDHRLACFWSLFLVMVFENSHVKHLTQQIEFVLLLCIYLHWMSLLISSPSWRPYCSLIWTGMNKNPLNKIIISGNWGKSNRANKSVLAEQVLKCNSSKSSKINHITDWVETLIKKTLLRFHRDLM